MAIIIFSILFSAGIDFRPQDLTSGDDPRTERVNILKFGLSYFSLFSIRKVKNIVTIPMKIGDIQNNLHFNIFSGQNNNVICYLHFMTLSVLLLSQDIIKRDLI